MISVSRMRRLDRWLGVPACWLLTLVRRLRDREASAPARPTRVLFVKLAEQGSTVLAAQAIRRATSLVGADRVHVLVFEDNRKILDAMAVIPEGNVITINARSLGGVVASAIRAVRQMRRTGIDTAIDLEFFARSSVVLSYLSGARWRSGFHAYHGEASYRGDLLTHRVSFNPYLHTSQAFDLLVAALDQPGSTLPTCPIDLPLVPDALPPFTPTPDERARVTTILRDIPGWTSSSRLILLNANASDLMPLRRWPTERYVELARRLLARYPEVAVGFTGAPDEAPHVRQLVQQVGSDRSVCFAGRTTIRELLTLYGCAEVLVTNDSGPAHFGALTTIDVITLFGPETPALFGALTPRSHPLWAGLPCSPCINAFNDRLSSCTDNACMQRLTVDQVFDETCRVYDERGCTPHER